MSQCKHAPICSPVEIAYIEKIKGSKFKIHYFPSDLKPVGIGRGWYEDCIETEKDIRHG